MDFLKEFVSKENIIIIAGNHDKIKLIGYDYVNFYLWDEIAFIHGDKEYKNIWDKKIKTVVMGHIHPAVTLRDFSNIKREKYKAFLIGKYKTIQFIVVTSFLPLIQGTEINEAYKEVKDFSIIPKDTLQKFKKFLIGKNKIYDFGTKI